jgi:ElaB/YqjD/DUF883 family membrane-anchored ribosome-binding protein
MNIKSLLSILMLLIISSGSVIGQPVSQETFTNYQQKVNRELQQLRDSLSRAEVVLETSKIYYEKAQEHLTLKEEINTWYLGLASAIGVFLGFVAGFLGVNFFNARARIIKYKEETQKELYQQLSLWVGANEETVKYLVKEQEKKQTLKKETKILVISHESDKEQRPYRDLKTRGFQQIKNPLILGDSFSIESIRDIQADEVVILDNQHKTKEGNWNFAEEAMKEKLSTLLIKVNEAGAYFVYYGDNNQWDGRIKNLKEWREGKDKGIATSITTLRKNLLELIYPSI